MIKNLLFILGTLGTAGLQFTLAGLLFFFSSSVNAKANRNESNDFSVSDTKYNKMSLKDLQDRFILHGESYAVDNQGRFLYKIQETRQWAFGGSDYIHSNWAFRDESGNNFYLDQTWSMNKEGLLSVSIKQYEALGDKSSRGITKGKLIKEKDFSVIKDFSPITWLIDARPDRNLYVRITPKLKENVDMINMSQFPLTLKDAVIYDSKGNIWAPSVGADASFMMIKTSKGSLALSYVPFKGSKEIGYVDGGQINLKSDDLKVYLKSTEPILSSGRSAKVYGFIDTKDRTQRIGSVHVSAGDKEDEFLKMLKQKVTIE